MQKRYSFQTYTFYLLLCSDRTYFTSSHNQFIKYFFHNIFIVKVCINIFDIISFSIPHNTLSNTIPDVPFCSYSSEYIRVSGFSFLQSFYHGRNYRYFIGYTRFTVIIVEQRVFPLYLLPLVLRALNHRK